MRNPKRMCDEDCNNCSLMEENPSNRELTRILNLVYDKFGGEFYKLIESNCPNLTCCNECHIDDFCHLEDCTIVTLGEKRK